jgi:peptidoglycan/xylan/chitin deacetylase (PgdA/CDA1 family)
MKDLLTAFGARCCFLMRRKPRLLVLTLHRVGPQGLDPQVVDRCFKTLGRRYQTVLPSELRGTTPSGQLAIVTIDDCHRDTYETIFPLALKHGIKIVTCVPTDFFLRCRWLWFDRLNWLFEHLTEGQILDVGGRQIHADRPASFKAFKNCLNKRDDWWQLANEMAKLAGLDIPSAPTHEYHPVTQGQLQEMLASGLVEVCAHSVTHPILPSLGRQALAEEVVECRRELEAVSGREVKTFCYPAGRYDERVVRAVQDAGYEMAFSTEEGFNPDLHERPFALRRYHVHRRHAVNLKILSGLAELQHRLAARSRPVPEVPAPAVPATAQPSPPPLATAPAVVSATLTDEGTIRPPSSALEAGAPAEPPLPAGASPPPKRTAQREPIR